MPPPPRPSRPTHSKATRRKRGGPRPRSDAGTTRPAIFLAAADAFSRHGFDGVVVDDIATAAGVNKAMIYYHFKDKLALYRAIVVEMLTAARERVTDIAADTIPPDQKLSRFIAEFVSLADERPYFPTLMLREIAEGALHLDTDTLARMRSVFLAFGRILDEGQRDGIFRQINPVLAYMTVLGPVMLNAARERAAAQPGRSQLPMFATVAHPDLIRHMQHVAIHMLKKD